MCAAEWDMWINISYVNQGVTMLLSEQNYNHGYGLPNAMRVKFTKPMELDTFSLELVSSAAISRGGCWDIYHDTNGVTRFLCTGIKPTEWYEMEDLVSQAYEAYKAQINLQYNGEEDENDESTKRLMNNIDLRDHPAAKRSKPMRP